MRKYLSNIPAWCYITPAGLPKGWKLVSNKGVKHPFDVSHGYDVTSGALIKTDLGDYAVYAAGITRAFPTRIGQQIESMVNGVDNV